MLQYSTHGLRLGEFPFAIEEPGHAPRDADQNPAKPCGLL
jgi:hypothetical protein